MEVYNKPNKFIFIILLLILSNQLFSQSLGESYVTKDTVTINKPIIIMIKGYDGKFILSEDLLESTKNIQRAIENHQISYIMMMELVLLVQKIGKKIVLVLESVRIFKEMRTKI